MCNFIGPQNLQLTFNTRSFPLVRAKFQEFSRYLKGLKLFDGLLCIREKLRYIPLSNKETSTFSSNSPFHGFWKVTKLLHETEAKIVLCAVREVEIIIIRKKRISISIISTSLTAPGRTTFASVSCRSLVTFQEPWNGLFLHLMHSDVLNRKSLLLLCNNILNTQMSAFYNNLEQTLISLTK